DQPDRADEFEDAERLPGFARQRTKGRDPLAYLVEHEDLHDARRSIQERGEDLQDPQQDVHRVPPPGFRVGARRAVSPRAIHVLSPDLVAMDNLMIIPLRVAQRTLCETRQGREVPYTAEE